MASTHHFLCHVERMRDIWILARCFTAFSMTGTHHSLSCRANARHLNIRRFLTQGSKRQASDCRMDIMGFFLPVFRCCLSVILSLNINILSPFVARKEQSARHREKSVVHSSCSRVASDLPRSSLPWHKMLSFDFYSAGILLEITYCLTISKNIFVAKGEYVFAMPIPAPSFVRIKLLEKRASMFWGLVEDCLSVR